MAIEIVRITHPDRVLFPEIGLTKGELAEYYRRVAPRMLPHVANRPLAVVRCPDGASGKCFFQKHWRERRPPSVHLVQVPAPTETAPHLMVRDLNGVLSLVQFGVIEIHVWGCRADRPEAPDRIVFDLDPGPEVEWSAVREAAQTARELLRGLGLAAWLKTTGGKGLHVVVPIDRRATWDQVSHFARAVAERLTAESPERFVATATKSERGGKIYIDWLRNVAGAVWVAPWSARARATAGVSAPWPWSGIGRLRGGDQVTVRSVLSSRQLGADPWADLPDASQRLTAEMLRRVAG
jgi:bifunctional non-homologous end joining protein LigD